jgi:hypothetical protein
LGRLADYRQRFRRFWYFERPFRVAQLWALASLPATAYYLLTNPLIHSANRLPWWRRLQLAVRMWRTTRRVPSATSYKAHLAMTAKLLEIAPDVEGVVVECGCWQGSATVNLSLACELVGRDLIVYDSFEGLPPPTEGDQFAEDETTGLFRADLETVRENVRRFGALDRCTFRKGWFTETLPRHEEPIVLAFLDVDYAASLDVCVRNLWPHLTEAGYLFTDEFVLIDYCALFWSERWWRTHFQAKPPGLIGSGSGVGTGSYYLGPWKELNPFQSPTSIAYTRKDFSGYWSYYPDESTAE